MKLDISGKSVSTDLVLPKKPKGHLHLRSRGRRSHEPPVHDNHVERTGEAWHRYASVSTSRTWKRRRVGQIHQQLLIKLSKPLQATFTKNTRRRRCSFRASRSEGGCRRNILQHFNLTLSTELPSSDSRYTPRASLLSIGPSTLRK